MMNSLRKCAFRVLIALTNSLDVIGSVEERILQACDADVDSDDEVIEERIKEEEDKCQDVLLVPVPSRLSNI